MSTRTSPTPAPLPLFDWLERHTHRIHTRAAALDRQADAALFFGRVAVAERLSFRAAELRESAR
jgi:hypothetical protein